jgi:hypothetical protein
MPHHGWTDVRALRLAGRCAIRMFSAVVMDELVMPLVKIEETTRLSSGTRLYPRGNSLSSIFYKYFA